MNKKEEKIIVTSDIKKVNESEVIKENVQKLWDKWITWVEEEFEKAEKKFTASIDPVEKETIYIFRKDLKDPAYLEEWLLHDFSRITDTTIRLRLSTIPTDLDYYICKRNEQLTHTYNWLTMYFPLELFRIYSKNIAREMSKNYSGSIYKAPEVWITHNLTGVPHKILRKNLSEGNWNLLLKNHACFRTELDLLTSHYMLKDLKKKVFKITT